MYSSRSSRPQWASGLTLMRQIALGLEEVDRRARSLPWKRLRPVIQPSKLDSARSSGSTLRTSQQASVLNWCSVPSGSSKADAGWVGADGADVAEVQLFGQLALIVQRFGKQHLGCR